MAKVDCIKLLRKAGIVSDAEAKQLLAKMQNLAELRAAERGMSFENAMRDIAGELDLKAKNLAKIQKRNVLRDIQTRIEAIEFAQKFKLTGDGYEALLFGSKKKVQGAGYGVDQIAVGLNGRYTARFVAELEQIGAYEDFNKGRYAKEFYLESEALGAGKPATTNKVAQAVAKAWEGIRKELVARLNSLGTWIEDMPGYVLAQTHSRETLVALNPNDINDALRKYREAFLTHNIRINVEKTFGGGDQEKGWRAIFQNLYTGNHESSIDTFEPSQFKAHGSLASRLSSPRVIWFADAESAFKYNELFGVRDYNKAIFFHIRQMTRNIALMDKLGANPIENYRKIGQQLQLKVKDKPDANAQMKSLDLDAAMRRMDVVTGKIDIPHNPSIARWFGLARAYAFVTTAGKMMISSFGDKPMMQTQMTYMGMSQMEGFRRTLMSTFQTSGHARETMLALGVVPQSISAHTANRWGADVRANYGVQQITGKYSKWIGMDWWTDVNQAAMADATATLFGNHAGKSIDALPPDVARTLNQFDISAREWNAMRQTAYKVDDGPMSGATVLTADTFSGIADSVLDDIVTARGLTASPANRKRARESLKQKWDALMMDSVYTGVPTGVAKEKYAMTWGGRAQSGTWMGEIARSVMMYKTFPITVAMKLMGREINGQGNTYGLKDWLLNAGKAKWRIIQLVAMSGIAGYASMAMKDMLAGRTPKPLMLEDGEPNIPVFFQALQQGGGLGIYGDFLFSEYDNRFRSFTDAAVGPVFGQADTAMALVQAARGVATGKEDFEAEKQGYQTWRAAERNLPFANVFYVKPVLDYFVFWNIREMLSPGVMRRTENSVERRNHQSYFISPAAAASIPISRPDEKLDYFLETITE